MIQRLFGKSINEYLRIIFLLLLPVHALIGQHNNFEVPVSIDTSGNAPHASAILELSSTDKGILIPRMTTPQRTAISATTGLMVFDISTGTFWYHDGAFWNEMAQEGGAFEIINGVVRSRGAITDDFVFGRNALPVNGENVSDKFFFFDQSKGAFRGGSIEDNDFWSPDSLGAYSFGYGLQIVASGADGAIAMGEGVRATGNRGAIALGRETKAAGNNGSTALGNRTKSFGDDGAMAVGKGTIANGDVGFVAGQFNDTLVTAGTNVSDSSPLFMVGNGDDINNVSNALVIRKNGRTEVGGNLRPMTDNTQKLGTASLRWDEVHAKDAFFDTLQLGDDGLMIDGGNKLVRIDADWVPEIDNTHTLGTTVKKWKDIFLSNATITDINAASGHVMINDNGSSGAGQVIVKDENDNNRINLLGKQASTSEGAFIAMFNESNTRTITIDASDPEQAGRINLKTAAEVTTLALDANFNNSGLARVITDELELNGGSDFAEYFDVVHDDIQPGMVVSIDPNHPGKLTQSSQAYDPRVAGVISGANGVRPGLMMGQDGTIADGAYPVALSGRIYVSANNESGEIQPGDLLTTSSTPGVAMKVNDKSRSFGTIIGKAMTGMDEDGFVLVLVNLQ